MAIPQILTSTWHSKPMDSNSSNISRKSREQTRTTQVLSRQVLGELRAQVVSSEVTISRRLAPIPLVFSGAIKRNQHLDLLLQELAREALDSSGETKDLRTGASLAGAQASRLQPFQRSETNLPIKIPPPDFLGVRPSKPPQPLGRAATLAEASSEEAPRQTNRNRLQDCSAQALRQRIVVSQQGVYLVEVVEVSLLVYLETHLRQLQLHLSNRILYLEIKEQPSNHKLLSSEMPRNQHKALEGFLVVKHLNSRLSSSPSPPCSAGSRRNPKEAFSARLSQEFLLNNNLWDNLR